MEHSFFFLDLFGRGGGGGSGGSSGGGGGEVIALIGYFPSYYLGKLIKKLLPRKAELIVSASFAAAFSIILLILGIAGGSFGILFMVLVVGGIWAGWGAAFFGVWDRLKKRSQKAEKVIAAAGARDPIWNESSMLAYARQTFLQYQYDWSTLNAMHTISYMTPAFARHSTLLLAVLNELERKNIMANVQIRHSIIVDAYAAPDASQGSFTVAFEASALDQLVDKDGKVLFSDTRPFIEYWQFIRSGSTWLLDSITQQTQDLSMANASIKQFAQANNMFYSLDMGWLFLPTRGALMARGKMGVSDINNHVVGTYNERLVQLYTFTPAPNTNNGSPLSWLVLQLTLPKSYGGIIVQPDKTFFKSTQYQNPPKGYKKYEFEWPDFNKRYDVHATDADRLAAFELLNPGFMAYLYDNDPGIGIEVADNTLYLFKYLGSTTTTTVDPLQYNTMLTIALKAFKELRL